MKRKNKFRERKLTPEDVAIPSGFKPTDSQWEEYLNRKEGKGRPAEEVFAEIKARLAKRFKKTDNA